MLGRTWGFGRASTGDLADRAARLRATVDVALFTPRRPDGRPFRLRSIPAGLGALPALEREQAAKFTAAAVAGMMNYGDRQRDQSCLAILRKAIELLSLENPAGRGADQGLDRLHRREGSWLVNAVGRLDSSSSIAGSGSGGPSA